MRSLLWALVLLMLISLFASPSDASGKKLRKRRIVPEIEDDSDDDKGSFDNIVKIVESDRDEADSFSTFDSSSWDDPCFSHRLINSEPGFKAKYLKHFGKTFQEYLKHREELIASAEEVVAVKKQKRFKFDLLLDADETIISVYFTPENIGTLGAQFIVEAILSLKSTVPKSNNLAKYITAIKQCIEEDGMTDFLEILSRSFIESPIYAIEVIQLTRPMLIYAEFAEQMIDHLLQSISMKAFIFSHSYFIKDIIFQLFGSYFDSAAMKLIQVIVTGESDARFIFNFVQKSMDFEDRAVEIINGLISAGYLKIGDVIFETLSVIPYAFRARQPEIGFALMDKYDFDISYCIDPSLNPDGDFLASSLNDYDSFKKLLSLGASTDFRLRVRDGVVHLMDFERATCPPQALSLENWSRIYDLLHEAKGGFKVESAGSPIHVSPANDSDLEAIDETPQLHMNSLSTTSESFSPRPRSPETSARSGDGLRRQFSNACPKSNICRDLIDLTADD